MGSLFQPRPGVSPTSLGGLKRHPGNELASSVFDLPRSNLARTLATINALLREGGREAMSRDPFRGACLRNSFSWKF